MAHHSSVWLKTVDGQVREVEREITDVCPYIRRKRFQNTGVSENSAIVLPREVDTSILNLILQYCRFHRDPLHLDIEDLMLSDDELIRLNGRKLDELALAAKSVGLEHLAELASKAIERTIEVLTPKERRESLQEELQLINDAAYNQRIRMLDELLGRKKAELKEKVRREEGEESVGQGSSGEGGQKDASFINNILSMIMGRLPEGKGAGGTQSKGAERAQDTGTAEGSENRNQITPSTEKAPQSTDDLRDSQEAEVLGEMKPQHSKKKKKKLMNI